MKIYLKDLIEFQGSNEDIIFGFRNFLDYFYSIKDKDKEIFLRDEPNVDLIKDDNKEDKITFISAFHFLCRWFELDIPEWMLKDKYILDKPYYPGATNDWLKSWSERTAKEETKYHNVFININDLVLRI